MKRKVIKQANQAYTITLPIDWVRRNNVDKNRELEVTEEEKTLIIKNDRDVQSSSANLKVEDLDKRNLTRHITALYAKGIDEINIESKKDITSDLSWGLSNTIGYALLCKKNDIFQIKDIGGTNYSNLDEIFKRVFQMVLAFYESAINDVFGEQKETLEGLQQRDREINKFCLFLQRAINKMSYPNQIKGRALFTYSFEIERIGDEVTRFWRANIKHKIKKTNDIKKLAEKSLESLGEAFELYYQFNSKKNEDLYSTREKIREESMKIKNNDKYAIRLVRHVVKISEDAADLSHLTLMINL
ncbi:MAG: hypothetical protein PHH54_01160 [Candidatus Nanoarchaeia archaeon]|nr:hypothetical protein [Candidatus Nanoarchaeia archaeon]MDD5740572.1 hypothetical protein [Candidatus Nanoarchaeia archaeon]